MYYMISLCYTQRGNPYITLVGESVISYYTDKLELAQIFEKIPRGFIHDNYNMAIPQEQAETLKTKHHFFPRYHSIPLNQETLNILCIEMMPGKQGLKKLTQPKTNNQ